MSRFVVIRPQSPSPQRIEAESFTYDGDDKMFVFRDANKKVVALVPNDGASVVATSEAVDNP
ncbi:hypothetical protein [Streptomyces sp. enrichment culture]|uniref:hypothetical protein n=1 Tax=Streptomyces sp. enrichment culture TaxID=1795815 RepID=UPI003F55DE7B